MKQMNLGSFAPELNTPTHVAFIGDSHYEDDDEIKLALACQPDDATIHVLSTNKRFAYRVKKHAKEMNFNVQWHAPNVTDPTKFAAAMYTTEANLLKNVRTLHVFRKDPETSKTNFAVQAAQRSHRHLDGNTVYHDDN